MIKINELQQQNEQLYKMSLDLCSLCYFFHFLYEPFSHQMTLEWA